MTPSLPQDAPLIWIVDDDEALRRSMRFLFASVGLAAETWESADAFLAAQAGGLPERPGVLVLDVRMPGMSGLDLLRRLRGEGFALPILIVTAHGDVQMAVEALKAGAEDFIEKPFKEQHLLDKVEAALRLTPERLERAAGQRQIATRLARLSPREHAVLEGILAGKPNKVMALDLDLSIKTIEVHRAAVMSKMEAESIAELVQAVSGGFVR